MADAGVGLVSTQAAVDEQTLDQITAEPEMTDGVVTAAIPEGEITVRDAAKREIDARLVPWDTVVESPIGLESFQRGSFAKVDPRKVVLLLGHEGDPAGRGTALEERDDGPYMTFKVSRTQRGDELLTLATDGVTPHVSVGYRYGTTKGEVAQQGGRRVTRITSVDLDHVATTYKPNYPHADVIAIRERKEEAPMTEAAEAPAGVTPVQPDMSAFTAALEAQFSKFNQSVTERIDHIEERHRQDIIIPGRAVQPERKAKLFDWANITTRLIKGERVSAKEIQERSLDDVLVVDNPGRVPDAFVDDIIGTIDPSRAFLRSTRQIPAPPSGMSITVPVLSQRATADVQSGEKTEIESTATKVTTQTFDGIAVAGGADVSIQIIRRALDGFMPLLMADLGAALGRKCDAEAIDALLNASPTSPVDGGALDPEDIVLGEAWENSLDVFGEPPDTLWMSARAYKAFINAKNDGSNSPLYWVLRANIAAGNTGGGDLSLLRPVYVRALNDTEVDVIIGPSAGFAWAEDGQFELTADVPALLGRDIALATILFLMPRYPAAFTTYTVASSG